MLLSVDFLHSVYADHHIENVQNNRETHEFQ